IGRVEDGKAEPVLIRNGSEEEFHPRFREAAYTPLKKLVEKKEQDFEAMKRDVDRAAQAAVAKKRRIIEKLKSESP
ncbi:MAG TPA: hypothetical protein PLA23_08595, partial [Methanospirillum sp.]|nr:hypothetical protein [Methanospirillum sp.]